MPQWRLSISRATTNTRLSQINKCCGSVANSYPTLWPHRLQHARFPCPSPTPRAYSNSCPLSQWCHPAISSSVTLFSSHPHFFPAPGSFPMSWLFTSGGQSIGASASASLLPVDLQRWFPVGWTGLISLKYKWLESLLQHHNSKASIFWYSNTYIWGLFSSSSEWGLLSSGGCRLIVVLSLVEQEL